MRRMTLRAKRTILRPVRAVDAPLIAKWKRDPFVQRMALGPGSRITSANQRQDIERALKSPEQLYWVILSRETKEPLGYIRVNWMESDHRNAWLRFALGPHRGRGYAKDAVGELVRYLLRTGTHRVEAEVYDFNRPSLGLLKGLGFQIEGLKRQAHFDGNRYRGIHVLGLLKPDVF